MRQVSGDGGRLESLRAALAAQHRILATFVMIPRVEIVELLATTGYDAVLFDLEHGPIEVADLPALVAAAQGSGLYAIARLADADGSAVARVLDTGVDGIVVPHVSSAAEASGVVAAGRFPPAGDRSLNPFVRGTRYGHGPQAGREAANDRVAIVAMLEGQEAVTALEDICAVDGLDAMFVGPVDLSAALGVPGEPEHPLVVEAVGDVFGRLRAAGLASCIYAHTPEAAARWFAAGASLVALSADIAMAARGFAATREDAAGLAAPVVEAAAARTGSAAD